jgi:hypothetical protein
MRHGTDRTTAHTCTTYAQQTSGVGDLHVDFYDPAWQNRGRTNAQPLNLLIPAENRAIVGTMLVQSVYEPQDKNHVAGQGAGGSVKHKNTCSLLSKVRYLM